MHWNATEGRYHEALRRLALVLLTLAVLAERVGRRSWPLRPLVLWLLCRAETRVRGFAARAGALQVLTVGYPPRSQGRLGEAARLAGTFRALAAAFFALARQAPRWLRMARRHDAVRPSGNRWNAARHGLTCGVRLRSYTDTS
jgi:hypothetical protein